MHSGGNFDVLEYMISVAVCGSAYAQLQFAAEPMHSQQHELPPSNVWLRSLCSTPAMAPNEQLKELPTIDTKCLDILKMFGYKGGNYSIKVSFGTFSISLENGNRIPEPVPVRRRKRPSAIKRDKNRRIEFLKNKNSATSSCPSSSGVNTLEGSTPVWTIP